MLPKKAYKTQKAQIAFFAMLMLVAIVFAISLPRLSLPFLFSYIFYLMLEPIIPALRKAGFSKNVAILIIFTLLFILFLLPLFKIIPTLKVESERLQYYLPKFEQMATAAYEKVQQEARVRFNFEIDRKYLIDGIAYLKDSSRDLILSLPTFAANILEWMFIAPLFLIFLLKDGNRFKHMFLTIVPNSLFERYYLLISQFNKKLGGYIFAKFLEAGIVGLIIGAGLALLGMRFSVILGIVASITNIIPYVGPVIGTVPGLIIAMIEYGYGSSQFIAVLFLYLFANVIDLAIVFPLLVSKIVDLHPIIVVTSVILGSQYWGVLGMVLSIPVAAAVKLIFIEIYREVYENNS